MRHRSADGDGDTHKPETILPSLTPLVFERFLPSLTSWLSPNCFGNAYQFLIEAMEASFASQSVLSLVPAKAKSENQAVAA